METLWWYAVILHGLTNGCIVILIFRISNKDCTTQTRSFILSCLVFIGPLSIPGNTFFIFCFFKTFEFPRLREVREGGSLRMNTQREEFETKVNTVFTTTGSVRTPRSITQTNCTLQSEDPTTPRRNLSVFLFCFIWFLTVVRAVPGLDPIASVPWTHHQNGRSSGVKCLRPEVFICHFCCCCRVQLRLPMSSVTSLLRD